MVFLTNDTGSVGHPSVNKYHIPKVFSKIYKELSNLKTIQLEYQQKLCIDILLKKIRYGKYRHEKILNIIREMQI